MKIIWIAIAGLIGVLIVYLLASRRRSLPCPTWLADLGDSPYLSPS